MTDFIIEKATTDHIPDLAKVHIEGWKSAYKNIIDDSYLNSLDAKEREGDWQKWMTEGDGYTFLAKVDDQSVGFMTVGRMKTPPPGTSKIRPLYSAEVYAIYLLEDYWGQGIGQALFKESKKYLSDNKHKSLCLWVVDGNKRAIDFYSKLGGQRIGKKQVVIGPNKVKEICYGWRDMSVILKEQ